MSKLLLTGSDGDVSVEVTLDAIAKELGEQYILNSDEEQPEFAYLAALALETYNEDRYSIEDTLMEFIRNTSALNQVDADECDEIEALLEE